MSCVYLMEGMQTDGCYTLGLDYVLCPVSILALCLLNTNYVSCFHRDALLCIG